MNVPLFLWIREASGIRKVLFPLFDIHVPKAFRGIFAPAKAQISKPGVKHDVAAFRTGTLHIILPELNCFPAGGAATFRYIGWLPEGRIHARTLKHDYSFLMANQRP
jgi:hypothetical protein